MQMQVDSFSFDWETAAKYYSHLRIAPQQAATGAVSAISRECSMQAASLGEENEQIVPTKRARLIDSLTTSGEAHPANDATEDLLPPADESGSVNQVETDDRVGFLLKRADENPDSYEALQQLASALLETDKVRETETALKRLLTEFPLLFGFWKKLGKLHVEHNKNWTAAEEVLERAVEFVGHNPLVWVAFIGWQRELQSSPELTRILIDRALKAAGRHWKAWPLWELSINFEEDQFFENREKWISAVDSHVALCLGSSTAWQPTDNARDENSTDSPYGNAQVHSGFGKENIGEETCAANIRESVESASKTLPTEPDQPESKPQSLLELARNRMIFSVNRLRRLFFELHGTALESSDLSWEKFKATIEKLSSSALKSKGGSNKGVAVRLDSVALTSSDNGPFAQRGPHYGTATDSTREDDADIEARHFLRDDESNFCGSWEVMDFLTDEELVELQNRIVEHSKTKRGNEILKHLLYLSSLSSSKDQNASAQKPIRQIIREKVFELGSQHAVDELCWDIRKKRLDNALKTVEKRAPYEKAVHRWFWHPDPLTPQRLHAWREFLQFAEGTYDQDDLLLLQKRCLEVCCSYSEFWRRCAHQQKNMLGADAALELLKFATIVMPRRKDIVLLYAQQLERFGKRGKAAKELQKISEGHLTVSNVRYFLAWVSFLSRDMPDDYKADTPLKTSPADSSAISQLAVSAGFKPMESVTNDILDNVAAYSIPAAALFLLEEGISRAESGVCTEILHIALAQLQFFRLGDCKKALGTVSKGRCAVPGSISLLRFNIRLLHHQLLKNPFKLLQAIKPILLDFIHNEQIDVWNRLQAHKILIHNLELLSRDAEEIEIAKEHLSVFMASKLEELRHASKAHVPFPFGFDCNESDSGKASSGYPSYEPAYGVGTHQGGWMCWNGDGQQQFSSLAESFMQQQQIYAAAVAGYYNHQQSGYHTSAPMVSSTATTATGSGSSLPAY